MIVEAAARLFLEHGYHGDLDRPDRVRGRRRGPDDLQRGRLEARAALAGARLRRGRRARPRPCRSSCASRPKPSPTRARIIAQLVEFWRGALPRTAPCSGSSARPPQPIPRSPRSSAAGAPSGYATTGRPRNCSPTAVPCDAGLTIDAAAATIFAIGHPETYRALVLDGAGTTTPGRPGCRRPSSLCSFESDRPRERRRVADRVRRVDLESHSAHRRRHLDPVGARHGAGRLAELEEERSSRFLRIDDLQDVRDIATAAVGEKRARRTV